MREWRVYVGRVMLKQECSCRRGEREPRPGEERESGKKLTATGL